MLRNARDGIPSHVFYGIFASAGGCVPLVARLPCCTVPCILRYFRLCRWLRPAGGAAALLYRTMYFAAFSPLPVAASRWWRGCPAIPHHVFCGIFASAGGCVPLVARLPCYTAPCILRHFRLCRWLR